MAQTPSAHTIAAISNGSMPPVYTCPLTGLPPVAGAVTTGAAGGEETLTGGALSFGVRAIGFDSMSPDPVTDKNYTNHKLILSSGALIIENLCGLAPIRGLKIRFTALPLKYQNADGAPCRAVAVED